MTTRILLLAAAVVALTAGSAAEQAPKIPVFTEPGPDSGLTGVTVAAEVPWLYVIDNVGTGCALIDYDLDGDLDIFQVQSSALAALPGPPPLNHLYRNDGNGRFTDVAEEAGIAPSGWGFGVSVGDYDNDGDPDMFVTTFKRDRLYRNEGNGSFKEVGTEAGVDGSGWGASSAFFDADKDGDLDLYVTKYLEFDAAKVPPRGDPKHPCVYKGVPVVCGPLGLIPSIHHYYSNNGDGTFTNVHAEVGMVTKDPEYGLGVITGDVDNDGDQDLYVANDAAPNFLYINDGSGRFSEEAALRGVAYSGDGRPQASMGIAMGDPDQDGDIDIFLSHFSHDYCTLYINDGTGFFEDVSLKAGLVEPTIRSLSWGTAFLDLDNDGDQDLLISNSHVYPEADNAQVGSAFLQRCQLFLNDGSARFKEFTSEGGPALTHKGAHRGAAFGDIDEDGDIDVVVTRMFERIGLYRNDLPPGNHWIHIRLVGTRSNRDAVGARVWLKAAGKKWLLERHGGGTFESANDPRLHTGFGAINRIDEIEIRWPSGQTEKKGPFEVDRTLTFVEPPEETQGLKLP